MRHIGFYSGYLGEFAQHLSMKTSHFPQIFVFNKSACMLVQCDPASCEHLSQARAMSLQYGNLTLRVSREHELSFFWGWSYETESLGINGSKVFTM